MALDLTWMTPQAPYMPIVAVGLLALLDQHGYGATAHWDGGADTATLHVEAPLGASRVGELLVDSEWPSLERIAWPSGKPSQGLKPTLKSSKVPVRTFRGLVESSPALEAAFLRTIVTDGAVDGDHVPARSRLLRGVKADLRSIARVPRRVTADTLAAELSKGPAFRKGDSGLGLGLVPEVQTFGGTTGPNASTVGAHSPLLYFLLWHGLLALPPIPVVRGMRRTVGGPLVTEPDVLSWPRWRVPVGLRSLRTLLALEAIHVESPSPSRLVERGIDAVYRARAVPLSNTVAVFRWGERVMG